MVIFINLLYEVMPIFFVGLEKSDKPSNYSYWTTNRLDINRGDVMIAEEDNIDLGILARK